MARTRRIRDDEVLFQRGGLTDERNRLCRPFPSTNTIRVPERIEVKGEWLTWSPPISRKAQIAGAARGIPISALQNDEMFVIPSSDEISQNSSLVLHWFARLASATSTEAFREYASWFGVFGAVVVPSKAPPHPNDIWFEGNRWRVSEDESYSAPAWPRAEPIGLWRQISRSALALLRISARLYLDPPELAGPEEWGALYPSNQPDAPREVPDVELGQIRRNCALNQWLAIGRVGFRVQPMLRLVGSETSSDWNEMQIVVEFGGYYNLFGALATQLMLVTARKDVYICAGCGYPYMRYPRPKRGQNNYCPNCVIQKKAGQAADRRRKGKMIEARRLASQGVPLEQIAARVQTEVSVARKWISGVSQKALDLGGK